MKTSSPFIYFCTMDGFFRILEKTSSELICTQLKHFIEKIHKKRMTPNKSWFLLLLAFQNLPSIYQLSSDFVKQLFRIQIQKGGKVLLWNQVKSRMEAGYSELILDVDFRNVWANWFE